MIIILISVFILLNFKFKEITGNQKEMLQKLDDLEMEISELKNKDYELED